VYLVGVITRVYHDARPSERIYIYIYIYIYIPLSPFYLCKGAVSVSTVTPCVLVSTVVDNGRTTGRAHPPPGVVTPSAAVRTETDACQCYHLLPGITKVYLACRQHKMNGRFLRSHRVQQTTALTATLLTSALSVGTGNEGKREERAPTH